MSNSASRVLAAIFRENNSRVVIFSLLVLAIGLRILFLFSIGNDLRWYDERNYHSIAISIKEGNGFVSTYNPYSTTHWAPLQGYVIAAIYCVAGDYPFTVRLFQDLLSGVILLLIFHLAIRFFSFKTGVLAAFIFAIHPIFIYVSNTLYPTLLFSILVILSFWIFQNGIFNDKYFLSIIGGVVLGLSMLAKPVGIFFIPAIILAYWLKWKWSGKFYLHQILIITFALMTISPWILYNYNKYRKLFFITQEGIHSFVAANNPEFELKERGQIRVPKEIEDKVQKLNEDVRNKVYLQEAVHYIQTEPLRFAKNYLLRLATFWRFYPSTISKNVDTNRRNIIISAIFYSFLIPFSFLGMIIQYKQRRKLILLYGYILFFAAGYALFIPSIRYRLPIEPFLILFASAIIVTIAEKVVSNIYIARQ